MDRVETLGMLSSGAHKAFDALTWDVGVAVDTDVGCKTPGPFHLLVPPHTHNPGWILHSLYPLTSEVRILHQPLNMLGGLYTLLPSRNLPSLPRKKSEKRKEEGRGREGRKQTQAPC